MARVLLCCFSAVLLCPVVAFGANGVSVNMLVVEASDAAGRYGTLVFTRNDSFFNTTDRSTTLTYTTVTPILDTASGQPMATLRRAVVYGRAYPPKITMDIIVEAGDFETNFVLWSPWVGFPFITPTEGQMRAFGSFTARDQNWNGARLVSLGEPGSGAFRAQVNGQVPSGITVTQLINEVSCSADGTVTGWQYDPPSGTRPLFIRMSSASALMAFSLTPGDRATCAGRLEIFGNQYPRGDLNCDSAINGFDIDAYITALLLPQSYPAVYPNCNITNADCNADGVRNNFDIEVFLGYLTESPPQP